MLLGIPPEEIAQRRRGYRGPGNWWESSTSTYLHAYCAYEILGIPMSTYLQFPASERLFLEAYIMARGMKQSYGERERRTNAKHAHWAQTWKQQMQG